MYNNCKSQKPMECSKNGPYEKFLMYGAEKLTDQELLAVIIRTGTKDKDAMELAKEVLELCGKNRGLLGLHHLDIPDLQTISGIGTVKAVKIKCIAELSNRISKATNLHAETFTEPAMIAEYYMESMRHLEREHCIALFMDAKCHLLSEQTISLGSISSAFIPRRDLFRAALKSNAAQLVLLHNHPSGDPTPSREDLEVTAIIKNAGGIVELPLVDHIIIGDNKYVSFKEKGLL